MSNERPILFKDDMIRAILEGRKYQTRRLLKFHPVQPGPGYYFDAYNGGPQWNWWDKNHRQHLGQIFKCRYGKPGDHLWVQEDYGYKIRNVGGTPHEQAVYRATDPDAVSCYDCNGKEQPLLWQPAETMPREASRITLEITNVRAERLQDISEEDALREGVEHDSPHRSYFPTAEGGPAFRSAAGAFRRLWQSIYGLDSWDANPWVWVIEFKRIDQEAKAA